jgi:hypothetical protein
LASEDGRKYARAKVYSRWGIKLTPELKEILEKRSAPEVEAIGNKPV